MERFASGVCVVSTRVGPGGGGPTGVGPTGGGSTGVGSGGGQAGGHDHAITATSFTWVSREPPLVLVCVHEDARFLDAVARTRTWGVSVLAEDARPTATWLATPGRPVVGQLDRVPHHPGPLTGAALVTGSAATLECLTQAEHPAGDHVVLVGRVVGLEVGAGSVRPLLHHRGAYAFLA